MQHGVRAWSGEHRPAPSGSPTLPRPCSHPRVHGLWGLSAGPLACVPCALSLGPCRGQAEPETLAQRRPYPGGQRWPGGQSVSSELGQEVVTRFCRLTLTRAKRRPGARGSLVSPVFRQGEAGTCGLGGFRELLANAHEPLLPTAAEITVRGTGLRGGSWRSLPHTARPGALDPSSRQAGAGQLPSSGLRLRPLPPCRKSCTRGNGTRTCSRT